MSDACIEIRYVLKHWQVSLNGVLYAEEEDRRNALRMAKIFARIEKVGIRLYGEHDSIVLESLVS